MGTQYQPDGLPNITGTTRGCDDNSGAWTGCFYQGYTVGKCSGDYNGTVGYFDASRSSSVYGNSQYVQPKSVSMLPIIKY